MNAKIPSEKNKYDVLRNVVNTAVEQIDPADSSQSVETVVKNAFQAESGTLMLPFEAAAEMERMTYLIRRWFLYQKQRSGKVIRKNVRNEILIAGEKISYSIHWLVEHPNCFEAIRFKYKSPEYSYKGRSSNTRPSGSAELLMIQRSGEAEIKKMGYDPLLKPVYGSIYYLKKQGGYVYILRTVI